MKPGTMVQITATACVASSSLRDDGTDEDENSMSFQIVDMELASESGTKIDADKLYPSMEAP